MEIHFDAMLQERKPNNQAGNTNNEIFIKT